MVGLNRSCNNKNSIKQQTKTDLSFSLSLFCLVFEFLASDVHRRDALLVLAFLLLATTLENLVAPFLPALETRRQQTADDIRVLEFQDDDRIREESGFSEK